MGSRTTTYVFDEISVSATGTKQCLSCKGTMTKTCNRAQTINPYNKDCLGNTKNAPTIRSEEQPKANADLKAWQEKPEICAACTKKNIPDIDIQMIGDDEMREIREIMPKVVEAQKIIDEAQEKVESLLVGKCTMVKVWKNRKYEEKLGRVDSSYIDRGRVTVYCDIVRKDRKGVTDTRESKRLEWQEPDGQEY